MTNPLLVLNSGNWTASNVPLLDSSTGSGYWSALADTTISKVRLIFAGSTLPASYSARTATWTSARTGSGTAAITFVLTSSSVPVAGALVTIQQGGVTLYYDVTDSSESIAFSLAPGSYTLNVVATGFNMITGQALTVSGNASVPLSLTHVSITRPSAPGLCTVLFSTRDASSPIANCVVEAILDTQNSTTDGNLIAMTTTLKTTDASGLAELLLIRHDAFTAGGICHITVTQPCGKVLFDKRVYCMNAGSGTADDLVAV